jgi:hypothetical protein
LARYGQWLAVGTAGFAALILGFVGFTKFHFALGESQSVWDRAYLTLQLFVLESGSVTGPVPWELEVARLLAPAVAGYAAVKALAVIFRERFERLRVRFSRRHIVICGLGRKGLLLARSLRARGERVVLVESDSHNDLIEPARADGALVLIGEARDRQMLRRARVGRANHLIAVCAEDGVNAEIAVRARELVKNRKGAALSCLVHVGDPVLCTLLRMQEIGRRAEPAFRLDFFDVFESGARTLLSEHPPWGLQTSSDTRQGHMVVVGLGRLGLSLVLQAATMWKSVRGVTGGPLAVTIIDERADERTDSLRVRHPWINRVCEISARAIRTDSAQFLRAEFLFDSPGRGDVTAVYVCLDDDSAGLSSALALHQHLKGRGVPIVVRMAHEAGLATLLREDPDVADEFVTLHAFALLNRTCNPDLLFMGIHESLARGIHRAYCNKRGEEASWEELDEDYRESNREQAAHIGVKLAAVGCDLAPLTDDGAESFEFDEDEIELLARMEHARWMEERRRSGWKWGPEKSDDRKTSPYFLPWEELGRDTQDIDRHFVSELPRLLAEAELQIVRLRRRPRERKAGVPA